jgi:hypothetical protein
MGFLRMNGLNITRCFFSIWTRERTQVSQFRYEEDYFKNIMLPWTEAFYFDELLPRFVLKSLNLLKEGEIQFMASSDQAASQSGGACMYRSQAVAATGAASSSSAEQNPYKRKQVAQAFHFPMKKPAITK